MNTPANSGAKRLILHRDLEVDEFKGAFKRASIEVFGEDERKNGSLYEFTFFIQFYSAELQLKKRGLLEFFHKTQRLPDYRRAEDAVKRGWARWTELQFGIRADEAKNKLKIRQVLLLYQLRNEPSRDQRQRILRGFVYECGASASRGDDGFFRSLGRALEEPAKTNKATHDFTLVLLHNWLTRFWWLMPKKNVAEDFASLQSANDEPGTQQKFYDNLRQLTSRRTEGRPGAYYSADWNGCFYSTDPPLIDFFEANCQPHFTPAGRKALL